MLPGESSTMAVTARFDVFRRILADIGAPLRPSTKLMDFGCGEGQLVQAALSQGLDAYGCDLYDVKYSYPWENLRADLRETNRVRPIQRPYRLPFDDGSMDVVISDQVFEHVLDYPQAIAELHRVMRPGGAFLHCFPSRYRWIEGHIFVPMASMFRPRWWLWIWAAVGIRNQFQSEMSAAQVVEANAQFLEHGTLYLGPRRIKAEFGRYFSSVEYVERFFLPHSRRLSALHYIPGGAAAYGLLKSRFLYGKRASLEQTSPAARPAGATVDMKVASFH
jgi:SAM-dependent methyltransferase